MKESDRKREVWAQVLKTNGVFVKRKAIGSDNVTTFSSYVTTDDEHSS